MHCAILFIQGQILTFSSFGWAARIGYLRIGSIAFKVACLHTIKDFTESNVLPFLDSGKCGEGARKALGTLWEYTVPAPHPQMLHFAPLLHAYLCTKSRCHQVLLQVFCVLAKEDEEIFRGKWPTVGRCLRNLTCRWGTVASSCAVTPAAAPTTYTGCPGTSPLQVLSSTQCYQDTGTQHECLGTFNPDQEGVDCSQQELLTGSHDKIPILPPGPTSPA